MAGTFIITPLANQAILAKGEGSASFTVTNNSGRALRGRALLETVPAEQSHKDWLKLDREAEQEYDIAAAAQINVAIKAPAGTPPGKYTFRLNILDVSNPDEGLSEGPTVTIIVPKEGDGGHFPWWIILVVLAVLALIGGLIYSLTRPKGSIVPALIGKPVETALAMLDKAGLQVTPLYADNPETKGNVFASTPQGGDGVVKNAPVILFISNGPTATFTVTPQFTPTPTFTPSITPSPTPHTGIFQANQDRFWWSEACPQNCPDFAKGDMLTIYRYSEFEIAPKNKINLPEFIQPNLEVIPTATNTPSSGMVLIKPDISILKPLVPADTITKATLISPFRRTTTWSTATVLFDLTQIPRRANIVSAMLTLSVVDSDGADPNISVMLASAPWSESSNDAPPCNQTGKVLIKVTSSGTQNWDISNLLASQIAGSGQINGFCLTMETSGSTRSFASRNNSNTKLRPTLTVIYYP